MIQLAYTSIANREMKQSALLSLLQQARMFNSKHNVSGILLYKDKSFFQVLEGETESIDKLMLSISGDTRHRSVNIIYRRALETRNFVAWSMGFVNIEEEQYDLEDWETQSFRFPLQNARGNLAQLLDVSAAKKLVMQFSRPLS